MEEEVGRLVEQARELQESAASLFSKSSIEEQSLRQHARSLSILLSAVLFVPINFSILSLLLEEDLQRARCLMVDGYASAFLSSKAQGRFLRMFLGPIIVHATLKDVQLKVKEETTVTGTALLFLLFPSVLLILRSSVWGDCLPAFPVQLYQVVHALNLNYAHLHPRHTNGFACEYDAVLNARTEGLLAQQRRGLRAEAVPRLPQEWTC